MLKTLLSTVNNKNLLHQTNYRLNLVVQVILKNRLSVMNIH